MLRVKQMKHSIDQQFLAAMMLTDPQSDVAVTHTSAARAHALPSSSPAQLRCFSEQGTCRADGHAPKRQKLASASSFKPWELPKAVVLDIEGTVVPISFVKEVLFPYAGTHLVQHLQATFTTPETQNDLELLRREQVRARQQSCGGAYRPS